LGQGCPIMNCQYEGGVVIQKNTCHGRRPRIYAVPEPKSGRPHLLLRLSDAWGSSTHGPTAKLDLSGEGEGNFGKGRRCCWGWGATGEGIKVGGPGGEGRLSFFQGAAAEDF